MDNYHHGDLRQALLDATEELLAERGPGGFALREVARRAGVSPAAPAHHFGSAAGLLTAVATLAFDGLAQALREGNARGGDDPRARLREQGVGYVRFAVRYPGRFRLMFGDTLLAADEALRASGNAAFAVLEDGVRHAFGEAPGKALTAEAQSAVVALWSAVHGCAHLMIAGRLEPCTGGMGRERFLDRFLPAMLERVIDGCVPAPKRTAARRKR